MLRTLVCTMVALVFAATLVTIIPVDGDGGPSASPPGSFWESSALMDTESERSRQLDEALALNLRLREERTRLVNEFEADRLDLDALVAAFDKLNENDTVSWEFLKTQYPRESREAMIGYQLMIAAYARREPAPGRNLQLLRKLSRALTERLGGPPVLPSHIADRIDTPAANP